MARILNSKTRILDTMITEDGRRQMGDGEVRLRFVSFTDGNTTYEKDPVSGSVDPGSKIHLEATTLSSDRISFETKVPVDNMTFDVDFTGKVQSYPGGPPSMTLSDGVLLITGSGGSVTSYESTGSPNQFLSASLDLFKSSLDNFKKLRIISSVEDLDTKKKFKITPSKIHFNIHTDNYAADPLTGAPNPAESVDDASVLNIFQDFRLSHIKNFEFLPPVNKRPTPSHESIPLFSYLRLSQNAIESLQQLETVLQFKQREDVIFDTSSFSNDVSIQIFDDRVDRQTFKMLQAVDFGEFQFETEDGGVSSKRVFFVGRIIMDSNQNPKFVNVFTIVFE